MFRPDHKIGPYTLVRTLGRGAFGEVWLAEKRSSLLTTQAALKLPLVAENEIEAVRQEAALWLQASGHPNIVPVLDAEVYDGQVVIASEYIAGGTLHEWMQANGGKAPSLEEAVAITNGILAGLDYLHRVGLTHRDLKPENVLLQDGIPRLTDFGLARVLKTEAQTSSISGTPRYMAPETFSGSYSAASDLWAVGVILQELLTSAHPFPTQEMMGLILAIQSQEPAPLPDTIPERLCNIVARLLVKSPSARFASASAVREALQNSLQPVFSVAVAAADAPALPPNNLPIQPTSFIGREKQIDELKSLLEHTHLLTLTGSGGCGKTRLSLEVADKVLDQYSNGVWLVELAPLSDPALVPQTVANVLGVREEPGTPLVQTLVTALKPKTLLLILDNCEHLLSACALLTDAILHACPHVKVLASSREGIGIAGETVYRIPSLSLPDSKHFITPEFLSQYEAVHLFVERATAALPAFAVTHQNAKAVAQVCVRLDGIPLAIELAAARVRSLPVEQIEARLHDRFRLLTGGSRTALPRHQTLRTLLDWSYDLLNPQEKQLLHRLSVFAGGWTLEAAECVCVGEGIEDWEVLDLLTSLVDKSLVLYEAAEGAERYRLLETVRQYAQLKLTETGDQAMISSQHLDFFLRVAEQTEPNLHGPEQALWLERLEREHDNLRAALEWGQAQNQARDKGLRLANALVWFWQLHSHVEEGRRWLEGLLERTTLEPSQMRAKGLAGAGQLAFYQHAYGAARSLLEESRATWRKVGNDAGLASSLVYLGASVWWLGEQALGFSFLEESVHLGRMVGDKWVLAMALWVLGANLHLASDDMAAHPMLEESAALFRQVGDPWGVCGPLMYLAEVWQHQGDYAAARAVIEEAISISRQTGDKWRTAATLDTLGEIALSEGEYAQARPRFEESLSLCREAHNNHRIAYELRNLGHADRLLGAFEEARRSYCESLGMYRDLDDQRGVANLLDSLGRLAATEGQAARAARLFGQSEALREAISATVPAHERNDHASQIEVSRAALSEDAFTAAWAEGRAMTMEQAIAYALAQEASLAFKSCVE